MNILVVSDTHSDTTALNELVSRKRGECELVIHLGDKIADAKEVMQKYPTVASICVVGNCDGYFFNKSECDEGTFTVGNVKLFYCHGHKYNVKLGYEYLLYKAKSMGARVVLFGHTHIPICEKVGDILLVNPGSLGAPRNGNPSTYAVLSINNDDVKCEICEV